MYISRGSTLLSLIPLISAHGRITKITTPSGAVYSGWDPELVSLNSTLPPLAAWSAANLGNIFVPPSAFNTSNITCHFDAVPGALHVNATAGSTLDLHWNEWPTSHKGPVLTYLAACNASCADADKDALEWVKIDEQGRLNSTSAIPGLNGTWASDVLISNKFTWTVKIPEDLRQGGYVLRHEIIALHVAEELDGAQAYPQCVNVWVGDGATEGTGSRAAVALVQRDGKTTIEGGVVGPKLYGETDKGILVNIHGDLPKYEIPGPKLWAGASSIRQPNGKKMG
ncbi:lytic polysaccharide monooxygenase [Lophiostoma macrostomum CBS 122681]|uniref:Lytic polysaccharide monooxygenase n=1 Tax=Lophiostoma macrostomum CBS 122681 TaxID=1314788 RepID=A0A6A6TJY6_9PLEO|nr:lytic polysaccharide monooxygenase [Lophiostoma macrostomum CBS 122681]